jgi:hypothetical protein
MEETITVDAKMEKLQHSWELTLKKNNNSS